MDNFSVKNKLKHFFLHKLENKDVLYKLYTFKAKNEITNTLEPCTQTIVQYIEYYHKF